jgi:DNA-binding GntR family transcriptional regulator
MGKLNSRQAATSLRRAPPPRTKDAKPGAERLSSSDQIAREIVRGLYAGRYVPGQKLTESDLVRRFQAGRGSVREALQRLAAEGVVTVNLHRGASIRTLTRREVSDMLEVVEALAGFAARRAAERLKRGDDLKVLRDTLKDLTAASVEPFSFEYAAVRDRFYRTLTDLSGNKELSRQMRAVQGHLIRVQLHLAYESDGRLVRLREYGDVVEAITAKNGAAAQRAMRQHVRRIAQLIDALPDQFFAP